jgi:hypothetical protein
MPTDVSKNFAIRRWPTAAVGADGKWGTPIVCPIACTQVVIENGDATNAQAVRTDPTDSDTEKGLPASLELTIRASSSGDAVFQVNEVVCRVAPAAGSGPVIVTFIR